ncbi:TPM domain-containing protein [Paenibacillus sp. FSL R10-2771]|uniref:TPM domain-containing protein n=1 Tax=Paenibacillus sp. FSL R10-2771 TaxID=2954693 RepID=UPI0030F591D2
MNRKSILAAFTVILMILLLLPLAPSRMEAAVPAHSESFYVNDFAGVIDQKTENYMVNYGVKLHQQTGAQVVLVTVNTTNGTPMEEYATSLFNAWGVGSADKNNGVLLLLSTQDDDYWAVPGKGLEDTLNDNVLSRILSESLEPDFAKKDYSVGARKTYGALIKSLGGIYSETVGTKNYVSDNAGVFKQVTKDYLNQSSNRYAATTGSGIYVVTIKNPGDKSLQDYTYAKFAGVAAGPKDVMLVLDIGGDNYHVLQGKAIDGVLTNERIGGILDTVLEPGFAAKDYAGGATATANAFYSFFLARADASQEAAAAGTKSTAAAATKSPVKSNINGKPKPVSASTGLKIMGVYLIIIALFSLAASGRNRLIARFGSRLNPFNQQNMNRLVTRFGSGSTMRQRRHRRHERHRNEALNHSSSQSSFWGSNEGGGGSSSGGGVGRYSSYEDENEGDGGSTNGGGAGRYSSYDDDDDNNSGGGGSASGGGGVGRHR